MKERWAQPVVLAAALNLDFLCIHPFRDGNGRVSRLLFLLACYHCGLEVGRYISLERLVEQNKERYYEVLEQSSARWHDGKHDAWAAMNFLLFILAQACKEFEQRVGQVKSPRGEKTAMVLAAIDRQAGAFSVSDLQNECPGVGVDLVRKVLKQLLERQGLISSWHDRKISPGDRWKDVIDENFKRADIIILLISADFIASDYCYEVEMKTALERHENGEAWIVPIIARDCQWKKTPFGNLQVLPKDGKPVNSWSDRDEVLKSVADNIETIIEARRKPFQGVLP
jgi:hypothetical protein